MAATNDRFSIRDYAAKMRIADSANSSPFAGGKDEKPPLPPISISRFRWWADELSTARSAAEAAETKAAETEKDELAEKPNDIIELYQPPKSPKPKTRMPKKRSIAELFASAPQIQPSIGQEGEQKVMMRRRKGERSKGPIKMEIRALRKEQICKPKMTSSGRSHSPQEPISAKALRKSAEGVVESKKKFLKLTMQKKHCILQTPNLTSRNQKKKLPVHGILKNKDRVASARKTRKMNNGKTVEFIKRCCKTTRHVSFSEKDGKLGHGKNKCSRIDLPQFKSLCKIFSDVLTKSSVMSNSSKFHGPQVVNAGVEEDTNAGVVDRADESSFHKTRSSDANHRKLVDSNNRSCSSTEKASMAAMIDLNLAIETCNDLDCFNPSTENLTPNNTNSVDLDSTEFNLQRVLPSITPTERNFVSTSNAAELLTTMKNPRSHSSTRLIACNEENEKLRQHYFHVDMNCYHHIPENQLEQHSYSMGSNKFRGSTFLSDSVSASQSKSTYEDFISLGFQMHPGTKFVEPYKEQNMDLAYSHGFNADKQFDDINANHFKIMKGKALDAASYQNDQLDWCQNQYHPTRERKLAEFIGPKRLDIRNNEPVKEKYEFLHCHANKTNFSFHDGGIGDSTVDFFERVHLRRQCNLDCELEPAVQPRIRLMGQNVVVGDSNRDCRSFIMPEKFLSKQRTPPEFVSNTTYGSSTDRLHKLSDSPSIFHPQFDSHIEDHGSESWPRKNIFSATGNNIFKTDKFMGNSISGEESMMHHQYYPTIASYQQNIQQNMLLSSTHWNHGQGASCGTFLTPQSLARYNVPENPFQTVQLQPSEKLPRWLQHERNRLPTPLYSCQTDLSQPCRFFGSNLIPRQSPYNIPTATVPFPFDNISPTKSSTFAPNSSQSSFLSAVTATNSTSEVTKNNAIKNKEIGPHSSFTGFSNPLDALKFLRRPHFEKQAKCSNPLEPQETNHATASDVQKAVNEVKELSNAESSSFSRSNAESVGARHGLKPNQKIDDENFSSVQSTKIFSCDPTSGKLLSPQKETANIYKF